MRQSLPFDETRSSDKASPLDHRQPTFDYEAIYAAIDGEVSREEMYEKLASAFGTFAAWIVAPQQQGKLHTSAIAHRAIAAVWATNPGLFMRDRAPSLSELSRELGVSRNSLSKYAAEFSREFGIRNRESFSRGWNFKNPERN